MRRNNRSRERSRIVREAGILQITSVITNEANLEGIEMQEW